MKSKKEIEERKKFLESLLAKGEFYEEELIIGIKQRAKINMKIGILNWVLDISKEKN